MLFSTQLDLLFKKWIMEMLPRQQHNEDITPMKLISMNPLKVLTGKEENVAI